MACPSFNVFKFIDSGVRVTSRNYYVRMSCVRHRQSKIIATCADLSYVSLLWCASSRLQHLTPNAPLRVCADDVAPTKYVRDVGIIDSDMSIRPMCHGLCPIVLELCATYAAFIVPSASQSYCLSLCPCS